MFIRSLQEWILPWDYSGRKIKIQIYKYAQVLLLTVYLSGKLLKTQTPVEAYKGSSLDRGSCNIKFITKLTKMLKFFILSKLKWKPTRILLRDHSGRKITLQNPQILLLTIYFHNGKVIKDLNPSSFEGYKNGLFSGMMTTVGGRSNYKNAHCVLSKYS